MKLIITESQFKDFLRYSILGKASTILLESQESKSIDAATKLLMDKLGWEKQKADNFIRINLRGDIPILRNTNNGAKFILGATRMYIKGELNNGRNISQLNTVLKYIASDAHINEYDRNLNGESLQTLVDRFSQNVTDDLEKDKAEVGSQFYKDNSQYQIMPINSFEEARKYRKYVSWCITHDKSMFDSYTNGGVAQFYFCLRNGFENESKVNGENCPLDSYGLSMIAVCVDENGGLKTCTCRWNHDNNGNDSILNTKQISELIGKNFYEIFKPNNKWKDTLEDAMNRLEKGEDPKGIFEYVSEFSEGYARIKLFDKWNFIDEHKNILFKEWFDDIFSFQDGFAKVEISDNINFIDKTGKLLSEKWFERGGNFNHGYATVMLNGRWNYIDKKGNYLSKKWFAKAYDFTKEYGEVILNMKMYKINRNGELFDK